MSNISQDVFSGRMELLKPKYDYRPTNTVVGILRACAQCMAV